MDTPEDFSNFPSVHSLSNLAYTLPTNEKRQITLLSLNPTFLFENFIPSSTGVPKQRHLSVYIHDPTPWGPTTTEWNKQAETCFETERL